MSGLLETVESPLTPAIVRQASDLLGESSDATEQGFAAVLATLLGALAMRTDQEGITELLRAAQLAAGGGGTGGKTPLDDLGASLASPALRGALMDHGTTIATQLLGSQLGPVSAALAGQSGLKGESMGSLIRLGGPMVVGAVAKMLGNAPPARGLADLVDSERPAIMAALPPGIRELLGPLAAAQTPLSGTAVEAARRDGGSINRRAVALIAAIVAVGLLIGLRSCDDQAADRAAQSTTTTPMVTEAPREVMEIVLPDGTALSLQSGHVGFELVRFLQSAEPAPRAFRFEALGFDSADNSLDAPSAATVGTVSAIMKAFPTMTARIVGHTDSEGDAAANQALSQARARSVEAQIEADGIAIDRIASEGRGQSEPIATNETAEGRAQNRRTIILVLTK